MAWVARRPHGPRFCGACSWLERGSLNNKNRLENALGDRAWLRGLVDRAEQANYQGICLTVDSPVYGQRERDLRNRFDVVSLDGAERRNAPTPHGVPDEVLRETYQARLTWDDVDCLRAATRLPVILKGIQVAGDAELAVSAESTPYTSPTTEAGTSTTLDQRSSRCPNVEAVRGRAEVIVGSGFMRGTDVVKALILGATAVLVRRLMVWALAAGGAEGVVQALVLLRREIDATLGNIGVRALAELTRAQLCCVPAPDSAPWPVADPVRSEHGQ